MVSHSPRAFPGMLCASPCSCGSPASPRVFKKQIPLLNTFSPSSDMHYRKLSFSYSFFFLLSRSQENLSKQFFLPGVNYWGNMLLDNQAEQPKIPFATCGSRHPLATVQSVTPVVTLRPLGTGNQNFSPNQ